MNHFRNFKAGSESDEFLKIGLETQRRTRVKIKVLKENEVLEDHIFLTGPNGICEGKFKGARSWGCLLPAGAKGKGLEVTVFVDPLNIFFLQNRKTSKDNSRVERGLFVETSFRKSMISISKKRAD